MKQSDDNMVTLADLYEVLVDVRDRLERLETGASAGTDSDPRAFISIPDAASMLSISEHSLRRRINSVASPGDTEVVVDRVFCRKFGSRWKVRRSHCLGRGMRTQETP